MKYRSVLLLMWLQSATAQNLSKSYDVIYGNAASWNNKNQDLTMDVFYHTLKKKLPLIMFMHGGGFFDGRKERYREFASALSQKGYTVANLTYRQGFDQSPELFQSQIALAVYRAQQDAASAFRYLVNNAGKYGIDTSAIIIGGTSAGGVTALGNAFIRQEEWDALVPGLRQALGPIDNAGNDLRTNYSYKAVFNLWGGIPDTTLISPSEVRNVPVLLVHSVDDEVIASKLSTHPNVKNPTLKGSFDIAQRFKNNGGCYTLYYIKDAAHGYGFSGQFVIDVLDKFVKNLLEGKCKNEEVENRGGSKFDYMEKLN